ncbi:hypothetical protein [Vitreoscilla stercoraria]|uniref:Uncharacterized protein n=1 Tax=Vitreoscilla stercoraria TaxID=61 RepID=A0ABY4ED20_VITST|nr:hypothetical protein [Vitreoscilla stercoraria]UOO93124.1 hypothetical protein LVJ81_03580 [Vitreoscilla stercoraria]
MKNSGATKQPFPIGIDVLSKNKKDLWLVLAGENDIAHKGNAGETMGVKIG